MKSQDPLKELNMDAYDDEDEENDINLLGKEEEVLLPNSIL